MDSVQNNELGQHTNMDSTFSLNRPDIYERESTTNLTQFSTENERESINILRIKSNLVRLLSSEINLIIDNYSKELFLQYLVSATCPLRVGETESIRSQKLEVTLQNMKEQWKLKIKESYNSCDFVKKNCESIANMRDDFLNKFREKKANQVLIHRVDDYLKIFESILIKARENYDNITSKYLVLRHNCRVFQDQLIERVTETSKRFDILQHALNDQQREAVEMVLTV